MNMPTGDFSPLLNAGVIGVVLWWFMQQTTVRLDKMNDAINRMTRAQLLTLLNLENLDSRTKEAAQSLLKELDDATKPNA